MQAIACLMNADLGVLSSNGREDGGIMLVTATLRYDTNLLLQALAVQENYNNLDAQVQADLTEEEWAAALEMAPLILAAGGAEADSVIYVLGYMLLKNVGGNERYMSEGFNSLRTALVRQNPALLSGLGRETAEESFLLPTRETCILVQEGVGKFPEYLSRLILSFAVGRKTQQLSPAIRRLAAVFVDERAHGSSMTGLKFTICNLCEYADEKAIAVIFLGWGRHVMPEIYSEWDDGELEAKVEEVFYNVAKLTELFHEEGEEMQLRRRLHCAKEQRERADEDVLPHRPVRYGATYQKGSRKRVYVLIAADSVIMMDGNEAASNGLGRRP